jgi:hypothetical protein
MIYAVLLSLGGVLPAGAHSRILPVAPAQEMDTPSSLNRPLQKPVTLPAPPRGQLLYENHCLSCHESVVHIRAGRRAKSLPEIRAWVMHWSGYLQLRWSREEVDDVVNHLNDHYYTFTSR